MPPTTVKQMSVNELKARLESSDPIALVDIRDADMYADWHIPGAVNVPVIRAMRANDPEPLRARAGELPKDRAVVLVCNAGISSAKAAAVLDPLGFDAISLTGGMRAWSGIHSEARVILAAQPEATFIQVRRNAKGCLSYLIGSDEVAAVIDPSASESVYADIAHREGLRITHVIETHVHADHFSRARALCEATGAALVMPPNDRVKFPYEPIKDGQSLSIGGLEIKALAAPGHTAESTCYLVASEALLTGDTLFVDSVGRPDLEKGDRGAEAGARVLYHTLHERVLAISDDVGVFPAHTAAGIPFDAVPISAPLDDIRGQVELLKADEPTFVERILKSLGAKPPNFTAIIELNEGKADLGATDPLDLEAGPNRCAVG